MSRERQEWRIYRGGRRGGGRRGERVGGVGRRRE